MEFQCRVIVQRRCTSCCSSVENIPLQSERHSARRQKLFAFPPESAFTFRPECCSESQRNRVRLHSGIAFTFDRIPHEVTVRFDDRLVKYDFGELDEVALAYAITIHKSQGSEFPAVVIPVATQHYMLLQRNLVYTGITRGKRLLVLIGQRKALGIAVHNARPQRRYSGLLTSLRRDR